ncbi:MULTISPECIES: antitoxin [unclassified Lonepinella]|uniref:antitoxin n=1 Tax=unclassified Lonepinella TaxID=2642006 RepID=UPI0036DCB603
MTTAKLFWTGNSQALRLPKAFRFNSKEVSIRKQGQKVILEPIVNDWSWLDELTEMGKLDESFVHSIEDGRLSTAQERDWSSFE